MTDRVQVYVDGSYEGGKVGAGLVILKNNEILVECSLPISKDIETRQVAGELYAVGYALQWCQKRQIAEIELYYDYLGIELWAIGNWKTNIPLTKRYAEFVRNCGIRIHFNKVKSHTGNRWNEYADQLAKKATQL